MTETIEQDEPALPPPPDWAALALNLDSMRTEWMRAGEDYQTATASALREMFGQWAEAGGRLKAEIAWQGYWLDKAQAAKVELSKATSRLDYTAVERVNAVFKTLGHVPAQKTAKHDDTCWQRHPGCLAHRVLRQLTSPDGAR